MGCKGIYLSYLLCDHDEVDIKIRAIFWLDTDLELKNLYVLHGNDFFTDNIYLFNDLKLRIIDTLLLFKKKHVKT